MTNREEDDSAGWRRGWRWQGLLALAAAFFALVPCASAQRLQTETFTEREGLPGAFVTDISQSTDGLMWFAARGALSTFDGREWESHLPHADLPEDFTPRHLAADPDGGMWALAARPSRGLGHYKDGNWSHIDISGKLYRGVRSRDMVLLHDDSNDSRLAMILGETLLLHNAGEWEAVERPFDAGDCRPLGLHAFGAELYVATERGVEYLAPGSRSCTSLIQLEDPEDYVGGVYPELLSNGTRRIWVVCRSWLGYYEHGELTRIPQALVDHAPQHDWPVQLVPDGDSGLYFGFPTSLLHYDAQRGSIHSMSIDEGLVAKGTTAFLRDLDKNLWVASLRGVTRIPPQRFETFDASHGLLENEVSAIINSGSGQFIFGHSWGISTSSRDLIETLTIGKPNPLELRESRVLDMELLENGDLWLAAVDNGVVRVSATGETTYFSSSTGASVNSVCVDDEGRLITATSNGLEQFVDGAFAPLPSPLDTCYSRKVCLAPDGTLYAVAVSVGFFWYDAEGWQQAKPAANGECTNVFAVHSDRSGKVWLGALDGLFFLEDGEIRRHEEGFRFTKPVYCVLESSDGVLWLGSTTGVYRWSDGTLKRYGVHEGLAGPEVNRAALIEDDEGNVWIGTDGGLSRFLGDSEHTVRSVPVEILALQGNKVGSDQDVQLLANRSGLTCRFRVVTFEGDRSSLFRSRLLGRDDTWSNAQPVGSGSIHFEHLDAGEYQLELQARTPAGDWGPVTRSSALRVITPLWQRGWFLSLAATAMVSLAALLHSFRAARKRSHGLELEVRESRDAHEASKRRHAEMFEQNPAALLLLQPKTGRVVEANLAAQKHFKKPLRELRGRTISELCGICPDALADGLSNIREGNDWVTRPFRRDSSSGAWVEIHMSPLELRDELIVQATIHKVEMAQRVEKQLQTAQEMQAVGELATGVAHDFNNLLTAILGHTELIEIDAKHDDGLMRHTSRIREAGERGASLIRHMMTFGREQQPQSGDLELNPIIRSVVSILQSVLGARITVALDLDESIGVLHGARSQIERILINLTLNARDAMPDGGELQIQTRSLSAAALRDELGLDAKPGSAFLRLSLCDTGVGMTQKDQERMFEPFFSARPGGGGIGMGLSAVQAIVHQHGGQTRVQTEPGVGTTVHLYLPEIPAALPRNNPDSPNGNGRILLVEDNDSVRMTISRLLTSVGYEVHEAGCAVDAREWLAQDPEPVDTILIDVQLPGENGSSLARAVRAKVPGAKVLLMSGRFPEAQDNEREQAFILKPFSLAKLGVALAEAP